jgi:PKD repeat protein
MIKEVMKMKRQLLPVFLCVLWIALVLSANAQEPGDVNESGTIDIVDALLVAQYYVGLNPDGFTDSVADVDCSGGIDIVDALLIARYYVGLITEFSCSGTPAPTAVPGSPAANFTFWPQAITTSDTVFFYGLASYSIGGTIDHYSWDFGDGSTGRGGNVNHTYTATGNYTATLTVTNTAGQTGTHSQTIPVSLSSGQSSIDYAVYNFEDGSVHGFSTNNGNSTISNSTTSAYSGSHSLRWDINATGAEMLEVKIDGPAVVPPGVKVLFRIWIPDGVPVDNFQPYVMPHNSDWSSLEWNSDWQGYAWLPRNTWHEFSVTLPGTTDPSWNQQIGVQVETTGAGSFTVYIDSIDWPNMKIPPKASFGYTPDRPGINASVSFDAVNSSDAAFKAGDADGTIASYAWDFGDSATGTSGTAYNTYTRAGRYPVTLTVTDNDGLVSSLTRIVWAGQNVPAFAPPLAVSGTQIVDANNIPFVPKAVAVVDSLTYTREDFVTLKKEWKVDAVRLPYITERWYYNVDGNTDRETYLAAFDTYLDWTYELGIYVLLDGWHEGGNTGNVGYHYENCKDGWNILAPRLKDRTHIIWEIYNEPYEITWAEWVPKAEELIDIILSYNPQVKVFAVPGVTWAQDFDVRTLKVNRTNVIYAAHPYPHVYNWTWNSAAWDNGFGYIVTEGYAPVLVTEFNYSYLDNNGNRNGYGEPLLSYLEQRGIGWFVWIWGGWGGPARDPNSYRSDSWQFFWESLNGIWEP